MLRRGSHAAAARLITRVAIAAVTISVIAAGIPWLIVITPRWLARGVSIVSLWAIFGFFLTAVPTAVVAAAWSWVGLLHAWRRAISPRCADGCVGSRWRRADS